jgi:GAF domain-containing protein
MREPLELLQSALDRVLALADQQLGNVQLIDWNAGYMKIVAQQGFVQDFLDSFRRVTTRDGCACGRALLLRDTVLIHDVTTDRDFLPYRDVARRAGFRAVQSTPLLSPSGALFGIISTHGDCVPNRDRLEKIKSLAQQTANELARWSISAGADATNVSGTIKAASAGLPSV